MVSFLRCLLLGGLLVLTGCSSPLQYLDDPQDSRPTVTAMAEAYDQGHLVRLPGQDEITIPVRVFGAEGDDIPVVMVHGLQSHSGWFVQSAAVMAAQGHPVYGLDRRGSGLSREARGDCDNFIDMIEDIETVVAHVQQEHQVKRVHVLGHCFGAIPATLFAALHAEEVASLILTTPGIYTHTDLTWAQKLGIGWASLWGSVHYVPVPMDVQEFTDMDSYQQFIATDPLSLQQATSRFYFEVHNARVYLQLQDENLTMPVFMVLAQDDQISDNRENTDFFNELPSDTKRLITYDHAVHIIEFSRDRDLFFEDLLEWLDEDY